MRALLLALALASLTGLGACEATPTGAESPMFKGVELYSWQDSATLEWRFALLPGTNRLKSAAEVRGSSDVAESATELKADLARLATAESVFWVIRPAGEFSRPPSEVVAGIIEHATSVGVTIHLSDP